MSNSRFGMFSGNTTYTHAYTYDSCCHSDSWLVDRENNKLADRLSNEAVDTLGWQGLKDAQVGSHKVARWTSCALSARQDDHCCVQGELWGAIDIKAIQQKITGTPQRVQSATNAKLGKRRRNQTEVAVGINPLSNVSL